MIKKLTLYAIVLALQCIITNTYIEMTAKATNAAPWNFEIYNKSGSEISVSASYEGIMGQIFSQPLGPSRKLRTVLTNTATPLIVKVSDPSRYQFPQQQFLIVPCPQKNVCGKTIFLTYDVNGLRPQTGVWEGTLGITDSGLSLKNNINQPHILKKTTEVPKAKPELPKAKPELRTLKDYYATLGISENTNVSEIPKAYRALALKWHPDKNPDNKEMAEEMFKEIVEAYEILKDPSKKARYDAIRRYYSQQ